MLYIEIRKAVQATPSTATDTVPESQSTRDYDESFSRRSSGVAGGDASPGGVQKPSRDTSSDLDDEHEDNRKLDSEIAAERGIIGKDEKKEEETKKSEAVEILKSLANRIRADLEKTMPNEREIEFLTKVWGLDAQGNPEYTRQDVISGRAKITGNMRKSFNEWLQSRFLKSIDGLSR